MARLLFGTAPTALNSSVSKPVEPLNTGSSAGMGRGSFWVATPGLCRFGMPERAVFSGPPGIPAGNYATFVSVQMAVWWPYTGDDGSARIWDLSTGELSIPPLQHAAAVSYADFSPDGQRLVTASQDGSARVWELRSGVVLSEIARQPNPVEHTEFSPSGRTIVPACFNGPNASYSARIWDAATGHALSPALSHRYGISWAAFSHDGRRVVTASEDRSALVWDAQSGQQLVPPLRHSAPVTMAVFSPDDHLLLTTSSDFAARVWDAATGEPVTPPMVHGAPVHFGSWSPEGDEIVTSSHDGTARVWDLRPTSVPISELRRQAELLSVHRLDDRTGAVPLTVAEIKARWNLEPIQ